MTIQATRRLSAPPVPVRAEDRAWAEQTYSALLGDRSLFDLRYIKSYGRVAALADLLRANRQKVVLTSGSFDILHEGHSMYLEAAREYGDFLVVGVDSDAKVRARKGPGRPAVPETERLRMVTHQRGVGAVVLKRPTDSKWALIQAVRPDALVVTEETYDPATIERLSREWCGEVRVLSRMGTVSTSARLRLLQLDFLNSASHEVSQKVAARLRLQDSHDVAEALRESLNALTTSPSRSDRV